MAKKIALLFNYDTSPQYRITFFRQENILRQRSLFFKSFNSNIPMSSVADQKFNSILKRIPVETVFDMLKFLTYEQWFALQFSNWRLAEIIKKNINYLAFPKFHSIGFYRYNFERFTPARNITYDGFRAKIEDLDEKEKIDLTEALAKLNKVPLALFRSGENPNKYNFLYISIKMTENVVDRRLIKLPVHPSTIEELALIRFWLLKLSQAYFKKLYAHYGILNPEFLSVLNPRTVPRKILFHANDVDLRESDAAIPADFAQFICARRIFLHTSLLEPHRNNLFKFITGRNAIENFCIYANEPIHGEFCELFVKSIKHMETSLESVPEIIECHGHCSGSGCWPNISGVKFTGTVDGPFKLNKYSYTFNNLWNKKVTFRLQLNGREFEYLDSFSIVKIRKMNQKLER